MIMSSPTQESAPVSHILHIIKSLRLFAQLAQIIRTFICFELFKFLNRRRRFLMLLPFSSQEKRTKQTQNGPTKSKKQIFQTFPCLRIFYGHSIKTFKVMCNFTIKSIYFLIIFYLNF